MSLRKDFSSLRKLRPLGVVPQNLLNKPVHKISIPTVRSPSVEASFITDPLNVEEKIRSSDLKTCYFASIAIKESGLADMPIFMIGVRKVNYNGTEIVSRDSDLVLQLSGNAEYLYFTKGLTYINKLALPKLSIKHAYFGSDLRMALVVLQKNFGYIFMQFDGESKTLYRFLTKNMHIWIGTPPVVVEPEKLDAKYREEIEKRDTSHMLEKTSTYDITQDTNPSYPASSYALSHSRSNSRSSSRSSSPSSEKRSAPINLSSEISGDVLNLEKFRDPYRKASPLIRQTRSFSKGTPRRSFDEEDEDADDFEELDNDGEPLIQETPASFDPPLRYTLRNGKKFVISYNDFKTLYNNDWINDTLIDFFIAYDMDHAVHELKSVQESDVYAFNSFFFTKMFSKVDTENPTYYENVRRWLLKVDLMKYDSVIIPINEHLHWYCAVIKHLPDLLAHAKYGPQEEEKKRKSIVEVYIIDSLRQIHGTIHAPLKKVIREYCWEKHGVEVPTNLIRFCAVRIPRQRNFNDCGLHVIYNIRKWLLEPLICEAAWRRHSKSAMRAYFKSSERSDMRPKSIATLLDLHSKQSGQSNTDENEECEDDIEEIHYLSSKPESPEEADKPVHAETNEAEMGEAEHSDKVEPKNTLQNDLNEKSQRGSFESLDSRISARKSSSQERKEFHGITGLSDLENHARHEPNRSDDNNSTVRTLDPRYLQEQERLTREKARLGFNGVEYMVVEHPEIRKLCSKLHPKAHTIKFLNSTFTNHNKHLDERKQKLLIELVKKYNDSDTLRDLKALEGSLEELLQEPAAPMDEPFVIEESDESSGELNRSVGDLRISEDEMNISKKASRAGNTPEATRRFMKQAEETSPSKLSKVLRSTRASDSFDVSLSDVEIVEDDVQIVLEGERSRDEESRASTRALRGSVVLDVEAKKDSKDKKRDFALWKSPKRRRLEESAMARH